MCYLFVIQFEEEELDEGDEEVSNARQLDTVHTGCVSSTVPTLLLNYTIISIYTY